MIRIEHTEVSGWNAAVRGMRSPHDSWDKSDSYWTLIEDPETHQTARFEFFMGEEDLKLAKKLAKAGDDHGKFLRMIHVSCDIVAPEVWWAQFDTYKIATVRNSCSKMHRLLARPFEPRDFSMASLELAEHYADSMNTVRNEYNQATTQEHKNIIWDVVLRTLPISYNQRSTVDLNYQTLMHMYHARKNHKLYEWHVFCDWIESLPYLKEMVIDD